MNIKPLLLASAISVLATSAWGQSSTQPLNLKLPNNLPASSSTASVPASSTSTAPRPAPANVSAAANAARNGSANNPPISTTPGVYYGDTSGRLGNTDTTADSQRCDDSTYDKAQVHGAVSTGVASGSHMGTSTYEGGEINVTKAFGDCDHPGGGISFSIGVNQTNFSGGRYRGGY